MSDSSLAWLLAICVVSAVGAAVLHALVAAFEQLPAAEERRLAAARRHDKRPTAIARLARDPERTANGAAVAYSIAEASALTTWVFAWVEIGDRLDAPWLATLVVAAATSAALSLLVLRALPRRVGRRHPYGTLRVTGPFAGLLIATTAPVRAVIPALRWRPLAERRDVVEQARGAMDEEDVELVRSVVSLGETLVREVMVPRPDMVTLPAGTDGRRAIAIFLRSGRSRLPLIGDGPDDVVGVLYLKDLLAATWDVPRALSRPVDAHVRAPFFVPESIKVDALLRTMQRSAVHLAIVVDEFGGVAGLVTIEDALEEIVGELVDEHDSRAPEPVALADGGYRVPARMPLDELGELFGLEIDDDDVDTVAGLLAKALGRVPIVGAEVVTHGLRLVAVGTYGRRKRLAWIAATREPSAGVDDA